MWLKTKAILLVLVLALLPSGAFASRQEPIYNVVNHPIPVVAQKLSRDALSRAIIAGGALTRRWQIGPNADGSLTGILDARGKHHATVTITYSQANYNVTLVSSTNLLQEGNLIHRNYNTWVRQLEKNIDDQLTVAGTAAR